MASLKDSTLQLAMPVDVDHFEIFLNHQHEQIQGILLECYASEIASRIAALVEKNCNGCIIEHPSQCQHPCLMLEPDEKISLYFDDALDSVCEATIADKFLNSLEDIKPAANRLELLKYTCRDWRILFCLRERQKLKAKTCELL